jgi:hypothetical protein
MFDPVAVSIDTDALRDELEFDTLQTVGELTDRQGAERAPRRKDVPKMSTETVHLKAPSAGGTSTYEAEFPVDVAVANALRLILEPARTAGALEVTFSTDSRTSRPRPPRPRASGLDRKEVR